MAAVNGESGNTGKFHHVERPLGQLNRKEISGKIAASRFLIGSPVDMLPMHGWQKERVAPSGLPATVEGGRDETKARLRDSVSERVGAQLWPIGAHAPSSPRVFPT